MSTERGFLTNHLGDIRRRLVFCAIAVGVGFAICYAFSEQLFQVLALPLKRNMAPGEKLVFTGLPDMFFVYIKVAFAGGLLVSSPFLFYQLWALIAPGIRQKENKLVIPFIFFSFILFVGGGLFGYFVIFPMGFKFFLGFENEYLQALPSVRQYFSLAIKLLIAFGLIFEMPVIAFFLARIGAVSASLMGKKRKYAVLLSFVLAAFLTPPDVITQFMMAIPMIGLYEVAIITARIAGRQRKSMKESALEES